MYYQNLLDWSPVNKDLFGPLAKLQAINTEFAEDVARSNLNYASQVIGMNVKHLQNASKSKKPEELINNSLESGLELYKKGIEYTQEVSGALESAATEYKQLTEKSLHEACRVAEKIVPSEKKAAS